MKKYFLFFAIVVSALAYGQRPNIIVFLVDDMGWMDTSVPFADSVYPLNKRFHTPGMQRLANEGMKFTSAYATPVCTPSRVSLLTGMNAAHHKVTNWTSPFPNQPTDQQDEQFNTPDWNYNGLSCENTPHSIQATTFPSLLKDEGYLTILVGKAHFGSSGLPGSNPYNFGFMINIAGHSGGRPQSYLGEDHYGNLSKKVDIHAVPDLEEYYGSQTFLTEALTKEALKSIATPVKTKQPFFLLMSHYAIHDPYDADKRFIQKYLDAGLNDTEAKYAALVEGMDKSLGDILDYLKKSGADKNTIIIFMSDNGGVSHYKSRSGALYTQNAPLRAGKGSVYEGGIREPMIVKWPGVTKTGSVACQYVMIEDFFPTILEMAKIKNRKTIQHVDGISFVNILKNSNYTNNARSLIWHSPNKWTPADGPGINFYSAIRKGDWKLVYSMRTGKKELYNIKNDIGETNDIAEQHNAKVKELSAELSNSLKKWRSPMPVDKKTNESLTYPE